MNQTYVHLHNISMQQRSAIIDKSKDATNMSSASHPTVVGTFVTGNDDNLLPVDLYRSENTLNASSKRSI